MKIFVEVKRELNSKGFRCGEYEESVRREKCYVFGDSEKMDWLVCELKKLMKEWDCGILWKYEEGMCIDEVCVWENMIGFVGDYGVEKFYLEMIEGWNVKSLF